MPIEADPAQPGIVPAVAPAPSSTKGVISLVLGIVAVVLLCVPFLNLLSVLLGITGLVLGIMAWIAANRTAEKRVAMPVIGTMLSGFATIAAPVVIVLSVGLLLPALAKAREKAREVVSHRPESAAQWTAWDQPATVGDVTVTLESVRLGDLPLVKVDNAAKRGMSSGDELVLVVKVANNSSTRTIAYRTLRGSKGAKPPHIASAWDGHQRSYLRVVFPDGYRPADAVDEATIGPGKSITDVLVFQTPDSQAEYVDVEMPGEQAEQEGTFKFRIPAEAWGK